MRKLYLLDYYAEHAIVDKQIQTNTLTSSYGKGHY